MRVIQLTLGQRGPVSLHHGDGSRKWMSLVTNLRHG